MYWSKHLNHELKEWFNRNLQISCFLSHVKSWKITFHWADDEIYRFSVSARSTEWNLPFSCFSSIYRVKSVIFMFQLDLQSEICHFSVSARPTEWNLPSFRCMCSAGSGLAQTGGDDDRSTTFILSLGAVTSGQVWTERTEAPLFRDNCSALMQRVRGEADSWQRADD